VEAVPKADLDELGPLLIADLKRQAKAGTVPPGQAIALGRGGCRFTRSAGSGGGWSGSGTRWVWRVMVRR
jgi:hypothetical protein